MAVEALGNYKLQIQKMVATLLKVRQIFNHERMKG